ncbi:MAG: Hsp20/alpha crystallin family protein [Spirochaetota bacterium]
MAIFKKNKDNEERGIQRRERGSSSPIERFRNRMNDLFEDFFEDWDLPLESDSLQSASYTPRLDITEDDNNIYVNAELPGVKEKDIDVELKDNMLTISGEKKEETEEKEKKYHRVERSYGYFQRSVNLSSKVDEDKIKASYKDGILSITLPKVEGEESKSKKIQIQ